MFRCPFQYVHNILVPICITFRLVRGFLNDIFIKGVINGTVGVTYNYPILKNGKYASVSISFAVSEIDPYDATDVMQTGSFRGLSTSLERRIWKVAGYSNSKYPEVGSMG